MKIGCKGNYIFVTLLLIIHKRISDSNFVKNVIRIVLPLQSKSGR
jgi:hypothetical protein